MTALKPITIVGGGLAGLTLGIGLRKQGIPVTIHESGRYPRHRVCGEFICGQGQQALERLGLREAFDEAGAIPARDAAFFCGMARSPARPLTPPALCLSRFKMDALLAETFKNLGGELREATRWQQSAVDDPVVRASGRRVQQLDHGWRWFGLKVHVRGVTTDADLEMHSAPNGYVGLCRLGGGEVNICGLFRRRSHEENPPIHWKELLSGNSDSALRRRLAGAVFDEDSFCSVAGLSLAAQLAGSSTECRIGDALTMIPPVTGNGMSMAFESAELAIAPLAAYSRHEQSWSLAQQTVAQACDAAFARRLVWARWLQWMMFSPVFKGGLATVALRAGWLWRLMFAGTR